MMERDQGGAEAHIGKIGIAVKIIAYVIAADALDISHNIAKLSKQLMGKI